MARTSVLSVTWVPNLNSFRFVEMRAARFEEYKPTRLGDSLARLPTQSAYLGIFPVECTRRNSFTGGRPESGGSDIGG